MILEQTAMTPEQTAEAIIEQVFIHTDHGIYCDGGAAINLIAAAIREAKTVEREACAQIAGRLDPSSDGAIAAEIRGRK